MTSRNTLSPGLPPSPAHCHFPAGFRESRENGCSPVNEISRQQNLGHRGGAVLPPSQPLKARKPKPAILARDRRFEVFYPPDGDLAAPDTGNELLKVFDLTWCRRAGKGGSLAAYGRPRDLTSVRCLVPLWWCPMPRLLEASDPPTRAHAHTRMPLHPQGA